MPTSARGAIMTFVVELVDDELCIEPIHRLLDLPAGVDMRARLADAFEISDAGPITPDAVDALDARDAMPSGDARTGRRRGLALAVPRAEARAHALGRRASGRGGDRRRRRRGARSRRAFPKRRGTTATTPGAVAALVDKGVHSAAILCRPVSVADTRAAAVDRVRMPQKTTFFSPKPRTGMVFRTLDCQPDRAN